MIAGHPSLGDLLTNDPQAPFGVHLARMLGTDPFALNWPRQFHLPGGNGHLEAVFDRHNALLTIWDARPEDLAGPIGGLLEAAGADDAGLCSRLLVYARPDAAGAAASGGVASSETAWADRGFAGEGFIDGFWSDGSRAILMARTAPGRAAAGAATGGTASLGQPTLPKRRAAPVGIGGWVCRTADLDDCEPIRLLLREVFPDYPVPEDAGALRYAMAADLIHGRVFLDPERRVAAYAAVEFSIAGGSPELTDCATTAAMRGRGLMGRLIMRLQEDLEDVFGHSCCHALAREDQPHMQQVLARRGWTQTGRLVSHFHEGGQWISARLWSTAWRPA